MGMVMGTKFKAANGLEVRACENGGVEVGRPGFLDYTGPAATFALEEFFRAKRDEELGRWRSRMNPHFVCYEHDGGVFVLDERDGRQVFVHRGHVSPGLPAYEVVAAEYFKAHPESKPWLDAKPGEVWLLTVDGHEAPFVVDGKDFNGTNELGRFICCAHDDEDITAGRRVWPGVAS